MVELSREEKLEYYKALSGMTGQEKRTERRSRYDEMLSEGMSPSEATTVLEGEELESREYLKEEQERKSGVGMGKSPGFGKDYVDEEDDIPDAEFLKMKDKAISEEDEYISGLERKERQKAVFEGLVGYGSREPLKEEIVSGAKRIISKTPEVTEKVLSGIVSGGKKLAEKLKPKSEKESKRYPHRLYKEEYHRSERGEPSLRDLGRGSLGAERYESVTPDFFGGGFGENRSSMGEPIRQRREMPPSTTIPFGGTRAPSTDIPFLRDRAPSVSFHAERKAPSTRVPTIREKPPKVTYKGAKKVSTKIPKSGKKPVKLQKVGKPISTKIGRPITPKTRVKVEEDDILGLKGFW